MNRRGFLKLMGATTALASGLVVLGDELWEPAKKTIVLPPAGGWNIAAHRQSGELDFMAKQHRFAYILQNDKYETLARFDPDVHSGMGLNAWVASELSKMRNRPLRYIVASV